MNLETVKAVCTRTTLACGLPGQEQVIITEMARSAWPGIVLLGRRERNWESDLTHFRCERYRIFAVTTEPIA